MKRALEKIRQLIDRWQGSRPGRALKEFGIRGGSLLASGIAYASLFSIFAALAIGFTILLWLVGSNPTLLSAVTEAVNAQLPGLLSDGSGGGLLDPAQLRVSFAWSLTGIIATGVLVWSALALVRAVRGGLTAIVSDGEEQEPGAISILRDVLTLVLLAIALLVTAGLEIAETWARSTLDAGHSGVVAAGLTVGRIVIECLVDASIVAYLLRAVARIETRARDILLAALVTAVALSVVRWLGVSVITGSLSNPLLAPFATILTLLAWVNLVARLVLMAAAWASTPAKRPE